MKAHRKGFLLICILLSFVLVTSCDGRKDVEEGIAPVGKGPIPKLKLVNEANNQHMINVSAIPSFNGASCLICVDMLGIKGQSQAKWINKNRKKPATPGQTPADFENDIIDHIMAEVAKCPKGSGIKLQLMYHYDPKPYYTKDATGTVVYRRGSNGWDMNASVLDILNTLAKKKIDVIKKVYLTSCHSGELSDARLNNVDAAFKISGVSHVVTVDETIYLACGQIAGALWPSMLPGPVTVNVWQKDSTGKQIGSKGPRIDKDHKFDIGTNSVVAK